MKGHKSSMSINTFMQQTLMLLAALSTFAGLAFGAPPMSGVAAQQGWIRIPPPGSSTTAGYFKLTNRSTAPLIIKSATIANADAVEFHQITNLAPAGSSASMGAMGMEPMQHLSISAGQTLTLEPSGKHLMIFGLKPKTLGHSKKNGEAALKPGDKVIVTLRFGDGRKMEVPLVARESEF